MNTTRDQLLRIEFETRIFVSFAITAFAVVLSEVVFRGSPTTAGHLGVAVGRSAAEARRVGFAVAAAIVLVATLLRMGAGSALTSARVMAFRVQSDALVTHGPYRLTRNPIYLADLLAVFGLALVMRPIGLLLPALLYVHYRRLIAYEEIALERSFADRYQDYLARAPRLLPTLRSLRRLPRALGEFELNRDGIRHNALYVLFLPGLAVAAVTGPFWHAIVIGVPGVVDWAVVHTQIGLPRRPTAASKGGD